MYQRLLMPTQLEEAWRFLGLVIHAPGPLPLFFQARSFSILSCRVLHTLGEILCITNVDLAADDITDQVLGSKADR